MKKRKLSNRNSLLSENWLCGVCNAINGPTLKDITSHFPDTLFLLCECESLHVHPQCLPDKIIKKGNVFLNANEIRFYCLQCLLKDCGGIREKVIPVDPISFYAFEKSCSFIHWIDYYRINNYFFLRKRKRERKWRIEANVGINTWKFHGEGD